MPFASPVLFLFFFWDATASSCCRSVAVFLGDVRISASRETDSLFGEALVAATQRPLHWLENCGVNFA